MPEVTRPTPHALVGYPTLLHAYPNCLVPMEPTESEKSMLTLIMINQMGKRIQALSSRQGVPSSVYSSANEVRAPPRARKSRVKGDVVALGRRPWVGAREGRRQREDRLRRRVDIERRCTWGAVEWRWDADAFGRRSLLSNERRRGQRAPPCISAAG